MGDAGSTATQTPEVRDVVPVLVIGAGPAGLLMSHILNRQGVKSLIVEKYTTRLTAPKAHAIGPRSFDILKQSGIDIPRLRAAGTKRDESRWVSLVTSMAGAELQKYPYERMDVDVLDATPEMFHNISQPVTESHIAEQLQGVVEIRKGHQFISCVNDDEGVTTVVKNRSTGEYYAVRSKYLIACDGARSMVRENVGIENHQESSIETLMTIELTIDVRPIVNDRRRMLYILLNPDLSGSLIGYDLGSKIVLTTKVNQAVMPIEKWNVDFCKQLVDAALGTSVPYTVDSFRPWILGRKVAKAYSKGRTFLAGDAAHSFPPSAGIGLNTGLADVHNLALKIAAVENGWAKPSTLESYGAERRPVADVNSHRSYCNSQRIHSMISQLGLTETDKTKARRLFEQALTDVSQRENLQKVMDELANNFDNLELHIGFVYGDPVYPENPSNYLPKYVPGARLPHHWIRELNDELMKNVAPVDLTHISELADEEKALRRYSTLDLCAPSGLTLIVNNSKGQEERVNAIKGLFASTFTPTTAPPLVAVTLEKDFELVFPEKAQEFLHNFKLGPDQQGGVLIRPDQHILLVLDEGTTAENVVNAVKCFVGDE
ncbi:hypothetical protein PV10_06320 [Exophiala mesophila]|uniref:FAD-binding domain-containing protein n=1 Tax=Exophiala mesophila TaxID=212818 RepID=A0A0D1ZY50_EXOME|nr:uncharacterized protein PV10_06320 [Exophiala mesophila]KIV91823.1 hypothetical protein PV10_06320 [Exophiala mesophila]